MPVTELIAEPFTHPVAEPVTQPGGELVTRPIAEPFTHPVAELVARPIAEPFTHPSPTQSPFAEPVTGSASDHGSSGHHSSIGHHGSTEHPSRTGRQRPPRFGRSNSGSGRPRAVGESPLDPDMLLGFFAEYGRDLPWRDPAATPWGVLVSEVMLQQTPVVRVLPVYQDWLRRWPTPADLAADSPADAIRAWGRLGYPRRALRLHAAATTITADHGGIVPDSVDALLRLPGIGEYTARAVAAFAFGARTPVVDTNVRRVLSRVVRGIDEPREPASRRDRVEMEALLPTNPGRAARFSAAVMELGALVCTAGSPRCSTCPLSDRCRWRLSGSTPGQPRRAVQAWHGTDRQVRGRMLAALRASDVPVTEVALAQATPDPAQSTRCLASLLADGLVVRLGAGHLSLPG